MKTNKTVKKFMSLMLCFALMLGTMATTMAANVGDTVDIASEFGSLVITNKVDTAKANSNILTYTSIGADYYTNYHEAAYYVSDTALNAGGVNVAVMKKGVQDSDMANAYVGSVYSGIKNSVSWTDKTNFTDEFIFDLYFKVPVAENVTTKLLDMSNSQWNGKDSENYLKFIGGLHGGLTVNNGYIYTAADADNALNETQLTADTWYRLVRHITGGKNGNTKILKEKIYVLDSANTIIAQMNDWTQVGGSYTAGSSQAMAAVAFTTDYPADYTGTEAAVAPLSVYKAPTAAAPTASLEGSARALEYIADGEDVDDNPVAERLPGRNYNYERQNAFITFRVPEDENGVLKLFRWNDASGKKAGVGSIYKDSFAVTVKGGKVYANVYNQESILNNPESTGASKSYTKLEEVSTGVYYTETEIPGVTITPNKWYTIEIKRTNMFDKTADNILNIYNGKVTDNGNGTVAGTLLKTWGSGTGEDFYLPYVDSTKTVRTASSVNYPYTLNRVFTFFAGYGYTNSVYVDGFRLDAWQNMSSANVCNYVKANYGVDNNWTTGFETVNSGTENLNKVLNIGDDFTDFRLYNGSSGNRVNDIPIPVDARIAYDSDFLSTGVTFSRTLPTINIQFPMGITYDDSLITLANQASEPVDFDANYNATTKTVTLTNFGLLNYGDTYILNVAPADTSVMGFTTAERAYTFRCVDSFVISDAKILDADDNLVTTSPANGAVINGSVKLENLSAEPRPYLVILALYKGTTMKNVVATSDEVLAGATPVIETPTITVDEEGCSAKVMVWESWTNIMPKSGAYTVPTP